MPKDSFMTMKNMLEELQRHNLTFDSISLENHCCPVKEC